jgi:cytochrome c biogenesis protein CcmG, thiol:disulfide interchange protein DsbE
VGHRTVRVGALLAAGALAIVAVLALAGCGAAPRDSALSGSQLQNDYKGAPAPLAKLFHEQNTLVSGGTQAFARELRALRGYPVVVNKWASWCPDCRQEFSIFQRVAPRYARTVAFVGDDVNDGKGAAWLRKFPLSFPSYYDRSSAIDQALSPAAASYAPATYFYNRAGKQVFFHLGPYLSVSSLEHDIRFYIGG